MGNKPSSKDKSSREIFIHEEVTLTQKTKTRFVLIIAMCCSTVINKVEPENSQPQNPESNDLKASESLEYIAPPKKPLNSKPRVRRYGYRSEKKTGFLVCVELIIFSINYYVGLVK